MHEVRVHFRGIKAASKTVWVSNRLGVWPGRIVAALRFLLKKVVVKLSHLHKAQLSAFAGMMEENSGLEPFL